eukprot:1437753-Rhodomonas_salina.2
MPRTVTATLLQALEGLVPGLKREAGSTQAGGARTREVRVVPRGAVAPVWAAFPLSRRAEAVCAASGASDVVVLQVVVHQRAGPQVSVEVNAHPARLFSAVQRA